MVKISDHFHLNCSLFFNYRNHPMLARARIIQVMFGIKWVSSFTEENLFHGFL